ncbi:TPA: bifunctional lysylphosphatidylglycerol flippase/synthetase MprF [Staphylococcus pseudintermedius]|uniref:bifunctional lysylphosphatidylglycerol flippase/synthetase MprF n=1 Tax=Staphylococcus pseudintermedius TaxID=283734 RepID=UPI000E27CEFD|nr:bifunctional lysylphosphatidylglycerol flippase/synthetase MprF [Staphylococcus pseudintermedius]EGQ0330948.1 bifunctional lysylphosphatidylglycerol flippase/synthetase MprF [Staphylococcus pseudintermedius]EGQ1304544.1 bifunctional lysylphosphatidylglycerol flippase/synthetase MprF [Staphylococcus pseudintermedius]EGQ2733776.1 bifunctional lysylphosphatidylglycerol flippase/synthetase MprF [Staphylococcus pseudintermedius]EGQ2802613.1 bifunctional lysylphosphatidylglycerol flippase/syntheta
MTKQLWLKYFKIAFILFLIVTISIILGRELAHIDFKRVFLLFNEISRMETFSLFLLGGSSVILLSLYDVILTTRFKLSLSKFKALRVGYIINAFNNIIGFGGFIGASVRLWFYGSYTTERKKLVKFVSYMLTSMLTGLSFLSILIVTHVLDVSFLDRTSVWFTVFLYIVAFLLPVFIIISWVSPVDRSARWLGSVFTFVSSMEWLLASIVLYCSFMLVGVNVSFPIVLSIFIVAAISGLLSFIPGGFGAFDLIVLLGLQQLGVAEEKVVLGLLLYRFAYYFFPLLIALVLTVFEFGTAARKYMLESKYFLPAKELSGFLKSFQKDLVGLVPSLALSTLVFMMSLILLLNNFSIIFDAANKKPHLLFTLLYIFNVSASLILLLNLRGIVARSKRAILFAIVAMIILLLSNLYVYGLSLLVVIIVLILAALIFAYRKSRVLKRPVRMKGILAMVVISVILLYFNQIIVRDFLFALDVLPPKVDFFLLRSTFWLSIIGMTILVVVLIYIFEWNYRRPRELHDRQIASAILKQYGGHLLSHLLYSEDKLVFVNEQKTAFIMYRHDRSSFIVLGDPVGNSSDFYSLLTEFYEYATYLGGDVIFYQVSNNYLTLYHDFGNQFFKLGEEALIPVSDFTVAGKKRRGFRATLNKLESLGYQFEILDTPLDEATYERLHDISRNWLGKRQEFYFSVGRFTPSYVNAAPVAVLKNEEGRIDAFCTLMPVEGSTTVSVDLIRWDKSLGLPFMDALYLHMILWAQAEGYERFNMGMATLSNVGQVPYGHLREKFAGRFYEHFNGLYSFQGLRQYKSKFNPDWESRFLIYHRGQNAWESLLKVTRVIRKKKI